ncbi:MAG: HlyD family efflux transporter periplasmic adaptor subunit [Pirellulales bacterium]
MSSAEFSRTASSGRASESTTSVDAAEVERAKREIQGLVQEIAELSRTEVDQAEFYNALLNKVVAALAAPGGAVWTLADTGGLQLTYQINLRDTGLVENPIGQSQHGRLLREVLQGTDGALVSPHSGSGDAAENDPEAAANPTDFLLVLAPVYNDQGPQGVVEIFQRAGARMATQRGYLRFLLQICEFAGDYLKGRRLRHLADKQTLWEQLETFTRTAHEKLDVRETAYTIANEGRRLIGCDRVSVAIRHGGKCRIEAVSGQDTFDKRSNVTVLLGKLATAVAKTGEDCWYTGDAANLAPQVEEALDAYVDESHTKSLAILPLTEPGGDVELAPDEAPGRLPRVIGAIIVEQMVDTRAPEGFKQRVDVVRTHSASALTNALEYEGLFLMPVWRAIGKTTRWLFGPALPKTVAIASIVAVALAAACLVPTDFTLEGNGNLRPVLRRNVFAMLDGEVSEILVEDDSAVKKGQLLVVEDSRELEKELVTTRGELQRTEAEINSVRSQSIDDDEEVSQADRNQQVARLSQLETSVLSLREQLKLLTEQEAKLKITSPIDGQVVEWRLNETLLGRPVTKGQVLMEVADPKGDWELEVRMPESRMGYISEAWKESGGKLPVEFILATHPANKLQGLVEDIEPSAEVRGDEGNTVLVRVSFDQKMLRETFSEPKIGAGVTAKIHCGRRSFAFVWLHDLLDFVRAKILFRL